MNQSTPNMQSENGIASMHTSWRKLPLARDKADTLLLMFACLLVLLPHTLHAAWWVSASCLGLFAWRVWVTLTGRRLPPSWVLVPIASMMMCAVFWQFRTFFGKEVGVTMLMMLLVCKLLEMHAKRDLFVVIYLGYFLLLTHFFDAQTIGTAAMSLCALAALLTAQLSFHYTGVVPSLWQRLKLGLSILGLAIPLTVVAFYLVPRIQGPLWKLPGDAQSGHTGLSDSMAPGNISKLALSEDIAFRVKFPDFSPFKAPPKNLLYWRGIVLTHFDGRNWTHSDIPLSNNASTSKNVIAFSDKPIHQEIIMEPNNQRWLMALDMPAEPASLTDLGSNLNQLKEMTASQAIHSRLRYEVRSYPAYQWQAESELADLIPEVELPAGFNPRTLAFAADLRQKFQDDESVIKAVLNYFRDENFVYTLEPTLLGANSIDDFLFKSREGFCEHYASAFVVLMRAIDIPARVVTGYQGGDMNIVDGYMEVRQSDAHAWAEVWLKGKGWIRVDPTAAVAPNRVMLSLNDAIPRNGITGAISNALSNNSLLTGLRMQWDAVNNSWNQWVLNYNQAKQLDFMRSLGLGDLDWPKMTMLFFAISALLMALYALPLMRYRTQLSPLDSVYLALCKKLEFKGWHKAPHEGPQAYLLRLKTIMPKNNYGTVEAFLNLYTAAKYGKAELPSAILVSRLKTLLKQYR
ncbi:transglutaminase TgpA family protein [Undibacterium sp. RuTC16W]|uniref:transglutaminase TgpA family protein n=1 Tax=Undibacterium sp. RuTC16W TaxID=3413048 RepID=UPI003BF32881